MRTSTNTTNMWRTGAVSAPRVLIVDADGERAQGVAVILRMHGAVPVIASHLAAAASAWSSVDVVILDDDSFGDRGLAFVQAERRHAATYVCIAARWSRFSEVRGRADYVFAKPYGAAVIVDALAASRLKQRAAMVRASAEALLQA